jgi:hypothetical protein
VYHVGLDLTTEQIKQLKQLALLRDLAVKDLVTQLVVQAIGKPISEPISEPIRGNNKNI